MPANRKVDALKGKPSTKGPASRQAMPDLQSIRNSRIVKRLDSAVFVELPAFLKFRPEYLDDAALLDTQNELLDNPEAGDIIQDTGGLRKLRAPDEGRNKGKRSGLRIIYFWCEALIQFWMFTLYDKDEIKDLTPAQKKKLRGRLEEELAKRIEQPSDQEMKRKK